MERAQGDESERRKRRSGSRQPVSYLRELVAQSGRVILASRQLSGEDSRPDLDLPGQPPLCRPTSPPPLQNLPSLRPFASGAWPLSDQYHAR